MWYELLEGVAHADQIFQLGQLLNMAQDGIKELSGALRPDVIVADIQYL